MSNQLNERYTIYEWAHCIVVYDNILGRQLTQEEVDELERQHVAWLDFVSVILGFDIKENKSST